MGDNHQNHPSQSIDHAAAGFARDEQPFLAQSFSDRPSAASPPFHSQLTSIPHGQLRPDLRSPPHASNLHYLQPGQNMNSLNMGAISSALPDYTAVDPNQSSAPVQHSQRLPLSGASTSAVVYQLQQNLQVPNAASGMAHPQATYGTGFTPPHFQTSFGHAQAPQHPNYAAFASNQPHASSHTPMQAPFPGYAQQSQYMYYPQYGYQAPYAPGFAGPASQAQGQNMYGRRQSASNMPGIPTAGAEMGHMGQMAGARRIEGMVGAQTAGGLFKAGQGPVRSGPPSSIPRGPPRKPKQSGHALWVGNLPPGTNIIALKDHFSRDATKDIESAFLIAKSNCAFVNYKTEESCTAAMHRFHDSRFNGVRVVCRLRRSSAPASGVPTGPATMTAAQVPTSPPPSQSPRQMADADGASVVDSTADKRDEEVTLISAQDKYFIVKSLTLDDLELSVRNGIWATQSHNEEILNKAFEAADNVYLIFSANKSGEYFGYARMASAILEDAGHLIQPIPRPENILEATDVPKSIPTAATEHAPKGRIIDDSARGTIFWEAELTDSEGEEEATERIKGKAPVAEESPSVSPSWGKPFKVEWMSTNRVPFVRTRGLRNPWNANRDVKIARDGTELEPSVGERLLQLFTALPAPPSAPLPSGMAPFHPPMY